MERWLSGATLVATMRLEKDTHKLLFTGTAAQPTTVTETPQVDKQSFAYLPPILEKMYAECKQGSNSLKLGFIAKAWRYLNEAKFQSRLKQPVFRLLKHTDAAHFRLRGSWSPSKKMLSLYPGVFNASQEKFMSILLHEMAHQAADQIDHLMYTSADEAHGPGWQKWMHHVGVPPSQFDATANDEYMEEGPQKEVLRQQRLARESRTLQTVLRTLTSPTVGQAATALINGAYLDGVIGPSTSSTNIVFIPKKLFGTGKFYRVPRAQVFQYTGDSPSILEADGRNDIARFTRK